MSTSIEEIKNKLSPDVLDDNETHRHRFLINSETSDRIYVIAQKKNNGEWQCSCPSWIFGRKKGRKYCKHLSAMLTQLREIDKLQGVVK